MGSPTHKIKCQVFELDVAGLELAQRLQADTSRMFEPRIVPVIDKVCGHVAPADRIYRFGRVSVDLGPVTAEAFEDELCEKLARELERALREEIQALEERGGSDEQSVRVASMLELFACFARTGSLPWWADQRETGVLDESARALLIEAPKALARVARDLAREPEALRRLPVVLKDAILVELCSLISDERAVRALIALPPALVQLVQSGKLNVGVTAGRCRALAWQCVLRAAAELSGGLAAPSGPETEPARARCEQALVEVASALGATYGELASTLHGQTSLPAVRALLGKEPIGGLIERRYEQEALRGHRGAEGDDASISTPELAAILELIRAAAVGSSQGRASRWRALEGALLSLVDPSIKAPALDASARRFALRKLLEQAIWEKRLSATILQRCIADLAGDSSFAVDPAKGSSLQVARGARAFLVRALRDAIPTGQPKAPEAPLAEGARELAEGFSDSEELYIRDSGLVILWPFLRDLLQNLGLTEADQFKDEAAQHRAVAILHYLLSGEPVPLEYELSLAKILCGLDVTRPIELDEPIAEAEAEECALFLTAVITQASILGDMSIPAFRGTFLGRRGMLAPKDGAWLLRVERETYDVVLDRFPWSFDWVALPWMEAPLRVEWR